MTNKVNTVVRMAVAGVVLLAGFTAVDSVSAQAPSAPDRKTIMVNDTPLPVPLCMPGDRGCRAD